MVPKNQSTGRTRCAPGIYGFIASINVGNGRSEEETSACRVKTDILKGTETEKKRLELKKIIILA